MLLLFWRNTPVDLDIEASGSSDAFFTFGNRVYAEVVVSGSSYVSVSPRVGIRLSPALAEGLSDADVEALLGIGTTYETDEGDSEADVKAAAWRRVRVTIETFGVEMKAETLEP